ncbi:Pre-mRNA-splicing factor syf2 [Platysternon megacephalum]|uniref:Pre-mRNA-splicing factor SYF2 n=1 Tax=Platysternon megacephalum TaxID=55544 RepID=A0A4D9ES88_9SAUR|nr:Pre-mRNA-splicing factor syf2 [Platysternon megacephalum]
MLRIQIRLSDRCVQHYIRFAISNRDLPARRNPLMRCKSHCSPRRKQDLTCDVSRQLIASLASKTPSLMGWSRNCQVLALALPFPCCATLDKSPRPKLPSVACGSDGRRRGAWQAAVGLDGGAVPPYRGRADRRQGALASHAALGQGINVTSSVGGAWAGSDLRKPEVKEGLPACVDYVEGMAAEGAGAPHGGASSASSDEESAPTAAEELAAQKREERLRKFRELHMKRNEARKLNHQEVVEEDKRLKLPANWEAKKARLEWELKVEEKKKECASKGEDYERVKLLEISAEDAERWERKKKRKNPDLGFSDYAAAQLRQYQRLTKQIKPDMEKYEKLREENGEELYPTANSLLHGTHVPCKEGVDRMVTDLEKQ